MTIWSIFVGFSPWRYYLKYFYLISGSVLSKISFQRFPEERCSPNNCRLTGCYENVPCKSQLITFLVFKYSSLAFQIQISCKTDKKYEMNCFYRNFGERFPQRKTITLFSSKPTSFEGMGRLVLKQYNIFICRVFVILLESL